VQLEVVLLGGEDFDFIPLPGEFTFEGTPLLLLLCVFEADAVQLVLDSALLVPFLLKLLGGVPDSGLPFGAKVVHLFIQSFDLTQKFAVPGLESFTLPPQFAQLFLVLIVLYDVLQFLDFFNKCVGLVSASFLQSHDFFLLEHSV